MPSIFGIIGYPLTHSFSPAYFTKKFEAAHIDAVYIPFPLAHIDEYKSLIAAQPGLNGLNVTIPYKQAVIPFLNQVDDTAKAIGAVNCISFKDGISIGYNTDITGFDQSLRPLLQPWHTRALILGTGGASLAAAYVLQRAGIAFQKVSRTNEDHGLTYSNLTADIIRAHKLIINTTPLGMYPKVDTAPKIDYSALTGEHLLYDLVYNPEETKFLRLGKAQGATIKNGLDMLILQAEAAWDKWK